MARKRAAAWARKTTGDMDQQAIGGELVSANAQVGDGALWYANAMASTIRRWAVARWRAPSADCEFHQMRGKTQIDSTLDLGRIGTSFLAHPQLTHRAGKREISIMHQPNRPAIYLEENIEVEERRLCAKKRKKTLEKDRGKKWLCLVKKNQEKEKGKKIKKKNKNPEERENRKEKTTTTRIEELEREIAELRREKEDLQEENRYLKDCLRRQDRHKRKKLWKNRKEIKPLKKDLLREEQINDLLMRLFTQEERIKEKKEHIQKRRIYNWQGIDRTSKSSPEKTKTHQLTNEFYYAYEFDVDMKKYDGKNEIIRGECRHHDTSESRRFEYISVSQRSARKSKHPVEVFRVRLDCGRCFLLRIFNRIDAIRKFIKSRPISIICGPKFVIVPLDKEEEEEKERIERRPRKRNIKNQKEEMENGKKKIKKNKIQEEKKKGKKI
ncbi:golgin subfamily A member 6-like protein 24 [Palaemon carinicauda]|uniref:golgin subfamily A member 6-like protein 24 n=1 Tax=Palaemon carinicauda TaxID=392227 RepID=UPI0035B67FBF